MIFNTKSSSNVFCDGLLTNFALQEFGAMSYQVMIICLLPVLRCPRGLSRDSCCCCKHFSTDSVGLMTIQRMSRPGIEIKICCFHLILHDLVTYVQNPDFPRV